MSAGFQNIIVGVDLGSHGRGVTLGSRLALDRARWIAERFGSRVTLIHSTGADEYWEREAGGFIQGNSGLHADGARLLDGVLDEFRAKEIEARLIRTEEKAWLAIIRETLKTGADLVIAGKRTESVDDGRKLGGMARKILRKAPCAVWLEDPRRAREPRVIVAAADLTAVGQRVLRLAGSLAGDFDAELHVVHAYPLPLDVQMEGEEAEAKYERAQSARAEAQIRSALAETETAAAERARLYVGITSPTRAILEVADGAHADLVVMGTVSRGGIAGFLVGNTAERLFDTLDCALLTVKPADFVCPVQADP